MALRRVHEYAILCLKTARSPHSWWQSEGDSALRERRQCRSHRRVQFREQLRFCRNASRTASDLCFARLNCVSLRIHAYALANPLDSQFMAKPTFDTTVPACTCCVDEFTSCAQSMNTKRLLSAHRAPWPASTFTVPRAARARETPSRHTVVENRAVQDLEPKSKMKLRDCELQGRNQGSNR